MFATLSTEFLKLRRSKMLVLAIIASIIPPVVKFMQYAFGNKKDNASWESFFGSGQDLLVLCMLTSVILISCFIFSMEYQYRTASYIFTTGTSKTSIFIAKIISIFFVIALLFLISAFSQLLFGFLTLKTGLAWTLLLKFAKVTVWYVFAYFLISTIVAMVVVLLKRFVLSAVVIHGYYILVSPFHFKNNPYISPFMTPTVVAAKLYNSNDYVFTAGYYQDVSISVTGIVLFLVLLAVISLAAGIVCYKKLDANK